MAIKPSLTDSTDQRQRYRSMLAIGDDLDDALAKQPTLYCDVADGYTEAVSGRDACKLDLEEAKSKHGLNLREDAVRNKEKLTEGHLEHCLAEIGEIKSLEREFLHWKAEVSRWQALKESFGQRKDMLQELVPMYLSRLYGKSSMVTPKQELADVNRKLAGQERVRRRLGARQLPDGPG